MRNCPAANAAIEQMLEDLKAAKAELLNTLTQTRQDLAEVAAAAEEIETMAFDEETWNKLETFVKAIRKMRQLQKHGKNKKEFAAVRDLEKLVDGAVANFYKSMQIEEV